jgi:hypothetical protein
LLLSDLSSVPQNNEYKNVKPRYEVKDNKESDKLSIEIKKETKTARTKKKRNRTIDKFKNLNTKHPPEFKLMSEFNIRASLDKVRQFSQAYQNV